MKMTVKCLGIAAFAAMLVFVLVACDEPVSSPQPKDSIINIATIQGVTIPVTGATPVSVITENAQYSGTVIWNNSLSTFAAETQYTATIILTAKTGYTLQGVGANFFRVAGATSVSNNANSGVITAVFPKTGGTASNPDVIDMAAIDGVTVPVTGATPVNRISENSQYSGTVTWNGSPSAFAANTQYTATITLTAKTGFTLQGVRANFFTVAEATSVSNSANSGVITAVFPKTGASSTVALTGTVSITGYAEVGQTLTANTDSLNGSGAISYQWKRGNTNIGTNSNSYQIQSADIGSTITVTVTRSGYSGSVVSAPTVTVIAEQPPTPGLVFTLTGSSYSVSRGTTNSANVIIPALYEGKPVTTIESNGFSSYTNMTSIRIPDRITSIDTNAFSNCTGLTSVTIPSSVTSISYNAFTGCTGLTSITIPFVGAALNGTLNAHFGYIFGAPSYSGQNAYIPASLKTVIITGGNSVPANAFSGCTNLTSIAIPNSVLSLGNGAFSGCTGLPSVTIPDSVTSIGNSAFSDCTGLPSITIPSRVTSIGSSAFSGCSGLPNVTIPDTVTSIGDSTFRNCTSLESITLPFVGKSREAATYEAVFGYIFGYTNNSSSTPPSGATYQYSASNYSHYHYYIPTSLKMVVITGSNSIPANNAFFNCTGLTSVTIGNSVTSIYNNTFYNCTGLTSVTIGNSVMSIGNSAFYGCTGLTSVTIPNSVTSIDNYAFYNCTGLTSVTIGNSVTSIGIHAFSDCTGLPSITIPDSVTSIGDYAFYGCTGLTSVTIPDSVTSIGVQAFYGCTRLTSVTIGNSVTSIGDIAFYGCTGLTSVTIPNSVTSIGDGAFSNCSGLTSVNFNATAMTDLPYYSRVFGNAGQNAGGITVTIGANVTKIPAYLFYDESHESPKITAVNFMAGSVCQSIGERAFFDCTGLPNITIPDSVTSIGDYAFYGCTGLTSVTIGDGVTSIGVQAFSGCTGLTSLTVGNSVTSIGSVAFYNCSGLTSVTIPNSVTSIGDYAFSGCIRLTSVTFQGTIASSNFNGNAFGGNDSVRLGDLREKFYATNATNGTPGTYTRTSGSYIWTKL
jgi:hypothetical protein